MNMFKAVKPTSVEGYLANVTSEGAELIQFLHSFIQTSAPTLKPWFAYNMLGYGSAPYINAKKQEIEWPVIALASQKQYTSVYICAMINGSYIAETWKEKLGRVSVGKSCIRIKKLEDVDLDSLAKVIKLAEKNPGFGRIVEPNATARKKTLSKSK